MSDAKLERLSQYVQELTDDLERPRIKTSEAAKKYGLSAPPCRSAPGRNAHTERAYTVTDARTNRFVDYCTRTPDPLVKYNPSNPYVHSPAKASANDGGCCVVM